MPKVLIFIICVLLNISIYSQDNPYLKFEKTKHDFGIVEEELGTVSHVFTFINIHNKPITLRNVVSGCGCTASDYTKTPINPKEKGFVKVTYTTTNRPGRISQVVTIITDLEEQNNFSLSISGEVSPRKRTKADEYPIAMGNLRFMTTHLSFGKIKNTHTVTLPLDIYNHWTQPMWLKLIDVPEFITYKFVPEVLNIGEEGQLLITYNAPIKNDYGLVFDKMQIQTNDDMAAIKEFYISAELEEDFSKLTLNDLKNAANMHVEELVFNFDTINIGDVVKHKFTFKNTGHDILHLRKIATSCGCTASEVSSRALATGEEGWIEVVFNSHGKRGFQRQTITVITNNPHNPSIQFVMQGYVSF